MGILSGTLSVRRYRVVGDLNDDWRELFKGRLEKYAFSEPPVGTGKEEIEGWVQVKDILESSFEDRNAWLYNNYLVFALRTDKKTLPARLFRATLERSCAAWCAEREAEKCPASVRRALSEELEREWLSRALPKTKIVEICWNIDDAWLIATSLTTKTAEQLPKRFFQTFGQQLVPFSPLDFLGSRETLEAVLALSAGGDA